MKLWFRSCVTKQSDWSYIFSAYEYAVFPKDVEEIFQVYIIHSGVVPWSIIIYNPTKTLSIVVDS